MASRRGANGTLSQPVGVNGSAARETAVPAADTAATRAWAGLQAVGSDANGAESVRSIAWMNISTGRPATLTVLGMFVITESSPPSAGRIRTGEAMNTFEAPGGRTTTPSRAGSPAAGTTL